MITPKRPGITPSRIFVAGLAALSLLVLAACSSSVVREGGSRVSTPKYGATAVVKRGDNLYRIATNNGITTLDLATWNDIDPPYTIYPGQRLRLYPGDGRRSEEHTSELQSLMRISYAVLSLKKTVSPKRK